MFVLLSFVITLSEERGKYKGKKALAFPSFC